MENIDEIRKLATIIYDLWNENYNLIEPSVLGLIDSKSEDIWLIEHHLDRLLDIPTDKGYELFEKLRTYYYTIDKEASLEYKKIWYEMYEDDVPEFEVSDNLYSEKEKQKSI